jgi:hypothetical protein
MKTRDISRITMPKYPVMPRTPEQKAKLLAKERTILGWDTETGRKNTLEEGKMTLLTNSDGNVFIPRDHISMLEFLTERRFIKSLNFFYNLRYDKGSI